MHRLIAVEEDADIPEDLRETPVGDLLLYHNTGKHQKRYERAQLLIGMCMDNRKKLRIPENFAFIIRSGGANLRYSEFKVSYAIAVGGVRHIALIGHTQCAMVNLIARKDPFIEGLCQGAGWERAAAEEHFLHYAPLFEIGNAIDFILSETARLSKRYSKIKVAPLLYKVEDNLLYALSAYESRPRDRRAASA